MRYYLITPVWGGPYVDTFLNVALPNLLTPGNLPALSAASGSLYLIYTAAEDEATITTNRWYQKLTKVVPTKIVVLAGLSHSSIDQNSLEHGDIISSMNTCHRLGIQEANGAEAAAVFIPPDKVWADGSFDYMHREAMAGKRVVAICSFRLNKDTFLPPFIDTFTNTEGYLSITPRNLTRLALQHLHPIVKSYQIYSDNHLDSSQLFWPVEGEGLLARFFHFHLMMVNPEDRTILPTTSFDADYVGEACPRIDSYHIVTDSDLLSAYELSPQSKLSDLIMPGLFSLSSFLRLVLFHTDHINRHFLKQKIRLHINDLNPEKWEAVEKESDAIIHKVLEYDAMVRETLPEAVALPVDASAIRTVAIFGSGRGGAVAAQLAEKFGWKVNHVFDNDPEKWGSPIAGVAAESPDTLLPHQQELVIVASQYGRDAIFRQLQAKGMVYRRDFIFFLDKLHVGDFEMRLILSPTVIRNGED